MQVILKRLKETFPAYPNMSARAGSPEPYIIPPFDSSNTSSVGVSLAWTIIYTNQVTVLYEFYKKIFGFELRKGVAVNDFWIETVASNSVSNHTSLAFHHADAKENTSKASAAGFHIADLEKFHKFAVAGGVVVVKEPHKASPEGAKPVRLVAVYEDPDKNHVLVSAFKA